METQGIRVQTGPLSPKGDYSGRSYSRAFAVHFRQAEGMPGCCRKLYGRVLKRRGLPHPGEVLLCSVIWKVEARI